MRRRTGVLGALGVVLAFVPVANGMAAPAAALAPAALPPDLVALEQKMGELQVTSMRFSLDVRVTGLHLSRAVRKLLGPLGASDDTKLSGESTTSPSASNIDTNLLGIPLTLRAVGTSNYARISQLGPLDHGRPWVKLGVGGLGELFTVNGKPAPVKPMKEAPPAAPGLAQPPFTTLTKAVAGSREVRELAPATVDGEPVQRFLAVLRPGELKELEAPPPSPGVHGRRHPKTSMTLELSLAANGLPVRLSLVERIGTVATTATLEIPAINFPLTIEAPPAAETISVAELRLLEKQTARHRAHKKKRLPS